MLQDTALDGSGAFRSRTPPPCTVWPRTVMRGGSRKVNSGSYSFPKANRRTEPSPRNPRCAARPKGVAAQRRVWGSQEGAREPYGALAPFCLRRETPAPPRRRAAASLSAGRPRQSPAARCERGRYRQAVQLSDHFLPVFLSTLAFFANLRKWFAYFDCFARFSKKFLLQK